MFAVSLKNILIINVFEDCNKLNNELNRPHVSFFYKIFISVNFRSLQEIMKTSMKFIFQVVDVTESGVELFQEW